MRATVPLALATLVATGVVAWRNGGDDAPTPTGIVIVAGPARQATAAPPAQAAASGTPDRFFGGGGIASVVSPAPPVIVSDGAPVRFRADDFVDPKGPDPTQYSDNQAWGDGWVREDGVTEIDGIPIPMSPSGIRPEPDQPAR